MWEKDFAAAIEEGALAARRMVYEAEPPSATNGKSEAGPVQTKARKRRRKPAGSDSEEEPGAAGEQNPTKGGDRQGTPNSQGASDPAPITEPASGPALEAPGGKRARKSHAKKAPAPKGKTAKRARSPASGNPTGPDRSQSPDGSQSPVAKKQGLAITASGATVPATGCLAAVLAAGFPALEGEPVSTHPSALGAGGIPRNPFAAPSRQPPLGERGGAAAPVPASTKRKFLARRAVCR